MSYVTTPGNGTIVQVINLEFISGIRVYYKNNPQKEEEDGFEKVAVQCCTDIVLYIFTSFTFI